MKATLEGNLMSVSTATVSSVARARTIVRLNTAYFQSKALQSAVELGVFDLLAEGPATVDEIREKLGIRHRLAKDFLDVLVGLTLLDREEDTYRNSETATEFLVAGQPTHLGGTARQHARLHYHAWAQLTEALREGRATSAVASHGPLAYCKHYEDLERARQVMTHMDAHNGFTADELARHIDWSMYSSFVDVGGARGNVAARLVQAHRHLLGGVFDLPALAALHAELMEKLGTTGQVNFHGGNFFTDPLPSADVLILGHVLSDWPVAARLTLVQRAFEALGPGGALVIYDAMITEGTPDLHVLLQRINHTMICDDTSAYSVAECRDYVEKAGFRFERSVAADTITDDHFVIAVKPR